MGLNPLASPLQLIGIDMLTARQLGGFRMGWNPLASPLQLSGIAMLTEREQEDFLTTDNTNLDV